MKFEEDNLNDFDFFKNIKVDKEDDNIETYQEFSNEIINDDVYYDNADIEEIQQENKQYEDIEKEYIEEQQYKQQNNNEESIIFKQDKKEENQKKIDLDDETITTNFKAFHKNGETDFLNDNEEKTNAKNEINSKTQANFRKFLSAHDDKLAKRFANTFNRFSYSARELKNCYINQKTMNQYMGDSQYSQNQIEQCFTKFMDRTKRNIDEANQNLEKSVKSLAVFPPLQMAMIIFYCMKKGYYEHTKRKLNIAEFIKAKELEHFINLSPEEQEKYLNEYEIDLKGHQDEIFENMKQFKQNEEEELKEKINETTQDFTSNKYENFNEAIEDNYFDNDIDNEKKEFYHKEFGNDFQEKIKTDENKIKEKEQSLKSEKEKQYYYSYTAPENENNIEDKNILKNQIIDEKNKLNRSILQDINFDENTKKEFDEYLNKSEKIFFENINYHQYTFKPNTTLYDEINKKYENIIEKEKITNSQKEEIFKRIHLEVNEINNDFVKNNRLYTKTEMCSKIRNNLSDIPFFKDEQNILKLSENIIKRQSQQAGKNSEIFTYTKKINKHIDNLEYSLSIQKEQLSCLQDKEKILNSGAIKNNKSSLNYELSDTLSKICMNPQNRNNIFIAGKLSEEFLKSIGSKENIDKSSRQIIDKITKNIVFENNKEKIDFEKLIKSPLDHFHTRALKFGEMDFIKLENQLDFVLAKSNNMKTIKDNKMAVRDMILQSINDEMTNNNRYLLKDERQNIINARETLITKKFFEKELKYANNTSELKKINIEIKKAQEYFEKQSSYLGNTYNRSFIEKTSKTLEKNIDILLDKNISKNFNIDNFRQNLHKEILFYVEDVRNNPLNFSSNANSKENAYYTALTKSILKSCEIEDNKNIFKDLQERIKNSKLNYEELSMTDIFKSEKLVKNAKKLNEMEYLRKNCIKNNSTYKTIFELLQKGEAKKFSKIVEISNNPTAIFSKSALEFLETLVSPIRENLKNGRFEPSFENKEKSAFKNKVLNRLALSSTLFKNLTKEVNHIRADTLSANYIEEFKNQNPHLKYSKGMKILPKNLNPKDLTKRFLFSAISKKAYKILNFASIDIENNRNFIINSKNISKSLNGDRSNTFSILHNSGGLKRFPLSKIGLLSAGMNLSKNLIANMNIMQKEIENTKKQFDNINLNGIKSYEQALQFFTKQKNNRTEYVFSKQSRLSKAKFSKEDISNIVNNLSRIAKIGDIKKMICSAVLKSVDTLYKTNERKGVYENIRIITESTPSVKQVKSQALENFNKIQNYTSNLADKVFQQMSKGSNNSNKDIVNNALKSSEIIKQSALKTQGEETENLQDNKIISSVTKKIVSKAMYKR